MTDDMSLSAAPGTHRLITEWSTPDPVLAQSLAMLDALPPHSVERLEAEAQLHMIQARVCWRLADQARKLEARKAKRNVR